MTPGWLLLLLFVLSSQSVDGFPHPDGESTPTPPVTAEPGKESNHTILQQQKTIDRLGKTTFPTTSVKFVLST